MSVKYVKKDNLMRNM